MHLLRKHRLLTGVKFCAKHWITLGEQDRYSFSCHGNVCQAKFTRVQELWACSSTKDYRDFEWSCVESVYQLGEKLHLNNIEFSGPFYPSVT